MTNETLMIIIFTMFNLLIIGLLIGLYFTETNKKETKKNETISLPTTKVTPLSTVKTNTFEIDSQYLLFVIDYNCNVALSMKLRPRQKANTGANIINDDIFISIVTETTMSIMTKLSPTYRSLLGFYMPNVGEFVTEMTHNKLIEMTTTLNRETIKHFNK